MSYRIVEHWDAVEIFSRVLSKIDKKLKLDDFQNNEILTRELLKYSKDTLPADVSGKIFGMKTNNEKKVVPKRPKSFYELGRKIRNFIPVVLEEEELEGYLKFIKMPSSFFPTRKSISWQPSDTQRLFEETKWLLYYYHQDTDETKPGNTVLVSGVAMAILSLKRFAKAEIEGFKKSENYIGKFEMYGAEERFIRLIMKLKENNKKDLNLLFYIGNGNVELALGQFHNLGRSIYSGTVVLEPLLEKNAREIKGKFFKSIELKDLPPHIYDYFKEKRKNILRVPCKFTSKFDFKEWIKGKEMGYNP